MQWHALFFSVKATIDGHIVSIPAETAKEAFAEAIDRQVAKEIMMSLISDGKQQLYDQRRWLFPRLLPPSANPSAGSGLK